MTCRTMCAVLLLLAACAGTPSEMPDMTELSAPDMAMKSAARLVFLEAPATGRAHLWLGRVRLELQDADNQRFTAYDGEVNLSADCGDGATLHADSLPRAVQGLVDLPGGLSIDKAGTCTLRASVNAGGVSLQATSMPIAVSDAPWTQVGTGLDASGSYGALLVHRSMPSYLYAKTNTALYKSSDGGASFVDQTPAGGLAGRFAVSSAGHVHIAGVRQLPSAGSWEVLGGWPFLRQFSFSAPTEIYGVVGAGVALSTTDGPPFSGVGTSPGAGTIEGFYLDPTTGGATARFYVALRGGGLLRSNDQGATWQQRSPCPVMAQQLVSLWLSGANLIAFCHGSEVYRSPDAGETWSVTSLGGGLVDVAFSRSQPQTLYAWEQTRGLFRSTDGGATVVHAGFSGAPYQSKLGHVAVHPGEPNTVFVLIDGLGLFKSTTGGQ